MKQMEVETEGGGANLKKAAPPPPPPPPPPPLPMQVPRLWAIKRAVTVSVTNEEIAKFWRQKRVEEEDHLLAAIKAAARIRARNLTEEDYKRFEESLEEDNGSKENEANANSSIKNDESSKELRVGIKDWWTKSKYAYLNQPTIDSTDKPKRKTSTYIPNLCCYNPAPPPTTSFGIF